MLTMEHIASNNNNNNNNGGKTMYSFDGKKISKIANENCDDNRTDKGRQQQAKNRKYTHGAKWETRRKNRTRKTQLENNTNLVGGYKALAKLMGLGK